MSATSTAGRDNGGASAGHLQQQVERARHLADRADGDAGVERGRVELLVPERVGFILRMSFLIENQRPSAHRSVLAVAMGRAGR